MTNNMTPKSKACDSLILILKRNLTKYQKDYEKFKNGMKEHKEISLNIKGYDVTTELEIQDLYGYAVITMSEYKRYITKLQEAQSKTSDDFQEEYYQAVIGCINNIINNLEYTKECEIKTKP